MRIAVVHSYYSRASPSGENSAVDDQVRLLQEAGHEVSLIRRETDVESRRAFYPARAALSAANISGPDPSSALMAFDPHVVHVHNLFPNWGTRWLAGWGDRTVSTLHNFRPICAAGTLFRDGHDCTDCPSGSSLSAVRHRCYRSSRAASSPLALASRGGGRRQPVIRHSAALVTLNRRARAVYEPLAPGRVHLVPNFVAARRREPERTGDWLYVGRLAPEKGVLELVEAFPDTAALVVVGDGPLRTPVAAAAARRPNIRYLGPLAREDVLELMRSARGLVVPSLWSEGIPTVALEALASGVPLMVSDACASASELTRNGAGRVFTVRDAATLADGVSRIEADSGSFSARAASLHEEAYSPRVWLRSMTAVYESVAARAA